MQETKLRQRTLLLTAFYISAAPSDLPSLFLRAVHLDSVKKCGNEGK